MPLEQSGFASGFSPLPLVFSDREGIEDFAHSMRINYITQSQKKKSVTFDEDFYSKIDGPLYLVGTYSVAIAYSPRFPKNFWVPVIQYGFCKDSTLKKAINEHEKILTIEILINHYENIEKQWKENISCPD